MPSANAAQHNFFGMASTAAGRAKLRAEGKKVPPLSVAKDFLKADKGRHFDHAALHRRHAAVHHDLAAQHDRMAMHVPEHARHHRAIADHHRQIAAHHEEMAR